MPDTLTPAPLLPTAPPCSTRAAWSLAFAQGLRDDSLLTEKYGLTLRQVALLALATRVDPAERTVRAMAGALYIGRGVVTRNADTLQAQGLVRRDAEPGDNRGCIVTATPHGAQRLDLLREIMWRAEHAARSVAA
jgi:DNA-binding MarR family transcriptional regulator